MTTCPECADRERNALTTLIDAFGRRVTGHLARARNEIERLASDPGPQCPPPVPTLAREGSR